VSGRGGLAVGRDRGLVLAVEEVKAGWEEGGAGWEEGDREVWRGWRVR
jgi:hypothetical protein